MMGRRAFRREVARPRHQREGGFSVLELLVALSFLGLLMVATMMSFSVPLRTWIAGRKLADEQQNARLVNEWMSRRIRIAGVGVPAGTTELFTEAALNTVAFEADVDGDGIAESHRFCLDTATGVVREQIGAAVTTTCTTGSPVTSRGIRPLRVVQLRLVYFNGQQSPLTPLPLTASQREDVAAVRIILGLDSNLSGSYESTSDLTFPMDTNVRNY